MQLGPLALLVLRVHREQLGPLGLGPPERLALPAQPAQAERRGVQERLVRQAPRAQQAQPAPLVLQVPPERRVQVQLHGRPPSRQRWGMR